MQIPYQGVLVAGINLEKRLKVVMPQAFQGIVHCNDLNLMQAQNRLIRHAGAGRYDRHGWWKCNRPINQQLI
jgi:hypothetical protein